MKRFAEHVLAVARRCGVEVSNLQLQKVMYFALGSYMNTHEIDQLVKEVYTSKFEAWDLGPVSRAVYREYKNNDLTARYNDDWADFDNSIERYLPEDVYDLVDESHSEGTHWWANKEVIMARRDRVYYELEDILNDYKKISR